MARSTMEVAFLGTQKVAFNQNGNDVKIVKVFYGDEADGETENGLSIVSMDVPLEVADEVFASGANFQPLELVRITFEVARAGKQKGNNLCVHIESAKSNSQSAKPVVPQGQQTSKPADPAKS